MDNVIKALSLCSLFKGISEKDIQNILQNVSYQALTFKKNQIIAIEGEDCSSIGIITMGSVEIKKIYTSGRSLTITTMKSGDIFGEVMVFSDVHTYPSTIVALTDTKIIFISKENILKLCSTNTQFLNNIMSLLSNKLIILSNKIKNLSYQTIRQKISNFIIDEFKKQKNLTLTIPCSRKELAEQLGLPRPSLSRELINMKNEGLIDFNKNIIRLLDSKALENYLL